MRLYGVRKFNFRNGQFYVHVWCHYGCDRTVVFLAADLAEKYGWDKDIDWLKPRLVCKCGRRDPAVFTMSDPD